MTVRDDLAQVGINPDAMGGRQPTAEERRAALRQMQEQVQQLRDLARGFRRGYAEHGRPRALRRAAELDARADRQAQKLREAAAVAAPYGR